MTIVINGTSGITGVPAIGSDAADTAVILNDSGTNSNTCRAWVNFNGTGTVAIRADFNVSSITDNGVGDYTVNFTNAMPDANYGFVTGSNNRTGANDGPVILQDTANAPTTTAIRILCGLPGSIVGGFTGNKFDISYINIAIFR